MRNHPLVLFLRALCRLIEWLAAAGCAVTDFLNDPLMAPVERWRWDVRVN